MLCVMVNGEKGGEATIAEGTTRRRGYRDGDNGQDGVGGMRYHRAEVGAIVRTG